jgi:hypothetical protein
MNYDDGQQVRLGDKVALGQDEGGLVVCVLDIGAYSTACPESEWSYLRTGAVIEFPSFGKIHYKEVVERDVRLIARAD